MYTWLFFKFYDYFRSKNNDDPLFNSVGVVFFAQVVHISLLALIMSKIFDFKNPVFSSDNSTNKMFLLPYMGLFLIMIFYYYKRKIEKYTYTGNGKSIKLSKLILIVFLVILIPLYFVIKLSGGEIWIFK